MHARLGVVGVGVDWFGDRLSLWWWCGTVRVFFNRNVVVEVVVVGRKDARWVEIWLACRVWRLWSRCVDDCIIFGDFRISKGGLLWWVGKLGLVVFFLATRGAS